MNSRHLARSIVVGALATALAGCWTSRVIVPAVAPEPGSTGYGLTQHTLFAILVTSSVIAVGVVAHSPSEALGQEGDSLWMVTDQSDLTYCRWKAPGQPECSLSVFSGGNAPHGDPVRIVDPINLGLGMVRTWSWNPNTGRVDTTTNGVQIRVVQASDYVADRAIWVLNGSSTVMYRCSIEGEHPVCRTVAV